MKALFFFSLVYSVFIAKAQYSESALVLDKKEKQKGVFSSYRIGVGKDLEIKSYVFAEPIIPHLILKKQWNSDSSRYVVATQHSFSYPSLLLRAISSEGTGGILPPDAIIPFILNTSNKLYFSKINKKDTIFNKNASIYTGFVGVSYGVIFGNSFLPSIDYPIVFQRTNSIVNGLMVEVGLGAELYLTKKLLLFPKSTFFISPIQKDIFLAQEIRVEAGYKIAKRALFKTGILVSLGNYPFGQMNKAIPLADLIWRW